MPVGPAGLVGRGDQLRLLRESLADVAAGRGRAVWVEGEPGIGKSALLAEGMAGAADAGCQVLWAAADEAGARFPLRVLLDAFAAGPGAAGSAAARIGGVLAGRGGAGLAAGQDAAAAEELLVAAQRLTADAPVLLVVDDAQWADELSLAVWGRLGRLVGQLPLLLVAACRPVPQRVEVDQARRALAKAGAAAISLGALEPAEVGELVGRLAGARPGPGLRRAAAQAGGNPLYVRETVDALLRRRGVSVRDGVAEVVDAEAAGAVPASLSTAIRGRLGFLSEPTAAVLRMASLLGSEFSVDHLGALTGSTVAQLVAPLEEAMAAGVVTGSGPRLAFRHGLLRDALYTGTADALRCALHRRAAQALAGIGAPAERVAEQLLAAPQAADDWTIGWLAEVAPTLVARAPLVAVELLDRAKAAAPHADPRREAIDTWLVAALYLLGRYEDAARLAAPLLAGARDPDVAGRAAWTLGYALSRMGRHQHALAVLAQALDRGGLSPAWTARVRALHAAMQVHCGHWADAAATALRAEAEGVQARDSMAIGYALNAANAAQVRLGADYGEILATIDRSLSVIGEEPEVAELRVLLLTNRVATLTALGRLREVDRTLGEALALAERSGLTPQLVRARLCSLEHSFFVGRWDDAVAELDGITDRPVADAWIRMFVHGVGALIAAHRDGRAAFDRHVRAIQNPDTPSGEASGIRAASEFPELNLAWAVIAERDGDAMGAVDHLMAVLDPDRDLEFSGLIACNHWWLPETARLALAAGDLTTAHAAARASASVAERDHSPSTRAAAEHSHGLVDRDPSRVLAAADLYRQTGLSLMLGQALENAAVLFGERADAKAARAALAETLEVYAGIGAHWDTRRATTRLRAHGIRRGPVGQRRQHGRPANGWDALTPTEVRIAELVARGLSNPDIAAELLQSRRTVEHHVSRVLVKLDARSRVEIAREVLERQSATTPGFSPAQRGSQSSPTTAQT